VLILEGLASSEDARPGADPDISSETADFLEGIDYRTLLSLADEIGPDEVDYIMLGVEMNLAVAEYGLKF